MSISILLSSAPGPPSIKCCIIVITSYIKQNNIIIASLCHISSIIIPCNISIYYTVCCSCRTSNWIIITVLRNINCVIVSCLCNVYAIAIVCYTSCSIDCSCLCEFLVMYGGVAVGTLYSTMSLITFIAVQLVEQPLAI